MVRFILENDEGGDIMEETERKSIKLPRNEKSEIDWAEYLDYSKFNEPGEINNTLQELYKKDFEKF